MLKTIFMMIAASMLMVPTTSFASAVLVDAQGRVEVTVSGKKGSAKVGTELPNGSVVDVGNGSAQVLLESGAMDGIPANTKYTVGSKAHAGSRTDLGGGIALAMKELAASGEGPTVHGMVKKVGGPQQIRLGAKAPAKGLRGIYPVGTAIVLESTVTFKWSEPASFKNPVLVLDNAKKRRLAVLKLKLGQTNFHRSAEKLHLKRGGSYSWFLAERVNGDVKGRTARFKFTVLSGSRVKALKDQKSGIEAMRMGQDGKDLLIAQTYFGYGLYDDMVNRLTPLYARAPTLFTRKLLRLGYARMGNMREAAKYE
jgi:hypothetical protein